MSDNAENEKSAALVRVFEKNHHDVDATRTTSALVNYAWHDLSGLILHLPVSAVAQGLAGQWPATAP